MLFNLQVCVMGFKLVVVSSLLKLFGIGQDVLCESLYCLV